MTARHFIPVLHASRADRPDEIDTVATAQAVAAALKRLGHDSPVIALDLDLSPIATLAARRPAMVFNLVEALAGDGRLAPVVPALMERHGLRFSGASASALFATLSKPDMKRRLREAGLPTPDDWREGRDENALFIVKAADEHASYGMDAGSVCAGRDVEAAIATRRKRFGTAFFAERFLAGREFNVALLQDGRRLRVLPIAEILFDDLPDDRPRIVDYEAKWEEESAAARGTPRRFGLEITEPALADRLAALSRDVWHLFGLSGYARVDFRLDDSGRPFILEANANPCLAPDAGFAATAAEAGLAYDALIAAILDAASAGATASIPDPAQIVYADAVEHDDIAKVRALVAKTGMFSPAEIEIAAELVETRLEKGEGSGYRFLMARSGGHLLGYACYGPTPGTEGRFDLYWIAVDPDHQGLGLGRRLLAHVETTLRAEGGERLYVETSSTPRYEPTRAFYRAQGFVEAARIEDFYRAGDDKVVTVKML